MSTLHGHFLFDKIIRRIVANFTKNYYSPNLEIGFFEFALCSYLQGLQKIRVAPVGSVMILCEVRECDDDAKVMNFYFEIWL